MTNQQLCCRLPRRACRRSARRREVHDSFNARSGPVDEEHTQVDQKDRRQVSAHRGEFYVSSYSLAHKQKLAGRKARKFDAQGKTLFLPAMELAYVFGALGHTPRHALLSKTVPRIDKMLAKLEASSPEKYGNGHQYWDDYCLGHFLRGVANFAARYQPLEAVPAAKAPSPGEPSDADIDAAAERDMLLCIEHSPKVQVRGCLLNPMTALINSSTITSSSTATTSLANCMREEVTPRGPRRTLTWSCQVGRWFHAGWPKC